MEKVNQNVSNIRPILERTRTGIHSGNNEHNQFTSYVKVPPDESGCRSVTLDITPFAERMHIARGPC